MVVFFFICSKRKPRNNQVMEVVEGAIQVIEEQSMELQTLLVVEGGHQVVEEQAMEVQVKEQAMEVQVEEAMTISTPAKSVKCAVRKKLTPKKKMI
jgi:hypothetical protein